MASIMTSGSDESSRKLYPKSHIEVTVDNFYSSKIYTSGSPISGKVSIVTKRDIHFDCVQIVLLGSTRTRTDGVNSAHEVNHTFLKMIMPIPESTYPIPRVLEAGQEYNIPFNFVIPHYLTVNACSHHVANYFVRDRHVLLPPSMGSWEKSDMSPAMATVEYAIKARVFRIDEETDKRVKVIEASQRLNVLPATAEEAPLNINKNDVLYKMCKTKSVRKTLLSTKQGSLSAEASQPGAVFIRPDDRSSSGTTAQVALSFVPSSADVQTPKVSSIAGKITAHTFFSAGTIANFPDKGDWNLQFSDRRGEYSSSTSLPPIAVDKARWTQHLSQSARRDSGYCSEPENADERSESGSLSSGHQNTSGRSRSSKKAAKAAKRQCRAPFTHTTTLQLPITLPTDKKTFIPTFHSCIASRVYVLQLSIVVSVGSTNSSLNLALPLQVAVESGMASGLDMGLPSFQTAVEQAEADEADAHLRPRTLAVPDQQYMQTSTLPGYSI